MHYSLARRRLHFVNLDWLLLGTVLVLAVFGIGMIYSATSGVVDPVLQDRWSDQILFLVLGIVAFFLGALLDYHLLQILGLPSFLVMTTTLILVELFGATQNFATRWLALGDILVQPTEAGKFLLIVTVAWFLSRFYTERKRLLVLVMGLLVLAGPLFLIYRQPDLGMVITMLFIIGAMVLISGIPLTQFLLLGGLVVAVLPMVYATLRPYMVGRLNMFFNPAANREDAFNVEQALISVGNGGWFGKGWTEGTQNQLFFLRVRHTDFIFSVVAEEFGFVGSVALLLLLGFVLWRLARTMDLAEDEFGRLLVAGVGALFLFQTFVNVGMNLQLMPVTGMTLPLVSSGGSSLVSMMFALGLTQSVNLRRSVVAYQTL